MQPCKGMPSHVQMPISKLTAIINRYNPLRHNKGYYLQNLGRACDKPGTNCIKHVSTMCQTCVFHW